MGKQLLLVTDFKIKFCERILYAKEICAKMFVGCLANYKPVWVI